MWRAGVLLVALLSAGAPSEAADAREVLNRARTLYNQRQFDAAIAAAEEARRTPRWVDHADLIAARAYLERFREQPDPQDLTQARERFRRIDPSRFNATERFEFLVGLGETLFLDQEQGAAAEIFESVLAPGDALPAAARERILDWWASALDHDAKPRPELDRRAIYQRIRDRMSEELAWNAGSGTACYWAAAAARGLGDLQGAWDAAQAGWVRAALSRDGGVKLRQDLDHLVQIAIIPEHSRILAQPAESLTAEWEAFKEKWGSPAGLTPEN